MAFGIGRSIEQWLYPAAPLQPRQRQKPMEILALGHSRSGTESLREALVLLGYDHVYHGFDVPESTPQAFEAWTRLARRKYGTERKPHTDHKGAAHLTAADFDAILSHCSAVTDQQGAMFASELVMAYPDAKVILNWRDPESWYSSIERTFGVQMQGLRHNVLPYFHRRLYWRMRYYKEVLDAYFHGSLVANGKWVYFEHCAKIRGLMQNNSDNFLEWTVQDGWEPLCKFLGKKVPDQEFPSGNLPAENLSRIRDYLKRDERKAMMNLMGLLAVFVSLIGIVIAIG